MNLNARPPWNYDLMVSGYLLALLPTLTILSGAVVALWRFVRTPSAKLFVLLGFLGAVAFGLVLMSLKLPPYIQTKAFYGLCALLPLCYFGVVGWDVLTRRHRLVRFALGTVLLVWAMNSFASVWIRGGSAPAHICLGIRLEDEGRTDAAASEFTKAVNAAPSNARARLCLASTLEQLGRLDEALQHAECAVELSPLDAACHLQLGGILGEQGNMERAISEARRAIELGPECNEAYRYLSATLVASGRYSDAVTVARDGLAAFPYDSNLHNVLGVALTKTGGFAAATNQFVYALLLHPDWVDAHLNLGLALIRSGNGAEGLKHLQEAVRLAPDSPDALNELAWLLATNPDAALRNGQEAVRLAERACELTEHRQAMFVGTLAAALAEDGQFDEARKMAGQAIALAEASGQRELAEKNRASLKLYEAGKPQRETQ